MHFAFDYIHNEKQILNGLKLYKEQVGLGASDKEKAVYILTNNGTTFEEDYYRIEKVRELGYSPYVMIYRKPTAPAITRHLQRWCNNRRLYNATSFKDYVPNRKGAIKEQFLI